MKLPGNKKLILDTATGRTRIVDTIDPRMDASAKIRIRKSTKIRVVKR